MSDQSCDNCKMRAKYDANPRSLIGRFWRFHIKFCPGWKKYMKEAPDEKRQELILKYNLKAN